ncbi:4-hydroxyphenylpyruvate dioxygenase [Lentzea albida]|uniref:4-hydroxymandelate synthase n=1 Tax=Lentzea albida TaxID=65499 RepID=A0A1H9C1H7_9PSEU|nr:4-hydroxyphenylpyruvate dioxygenase [Lentzea albida]SEP94817.1 4-hydroxymandelate synthase [Lentzea albida]
MIDDALRLDHVALYVQDLDARVEEMVAKYGFTVIAETDPAVTTHRTAALRQGHIVLAVIEGLEDGHPASAYVDAHGDGVADIVLRTPDVAAAFETAVAAGARPLLRPHTQNGVVTAAIGGFGDVRHTFVQRPEDLPAGAPPPGLVERSATAPFTGIGLLELDHVAICVEAGQLEPTVRFYESALGFRKIFEERIVVGAQAMDSQVVQNASGDVTFTIIEPDTSRAAGQIDAFIKDHDGAGVQHLAFSSHDIVRAVGTLQDNGIDFLTTPDSYYDLLPGRMELAAHSVDELKALGVLADADHAGQLYQIFTRSTHPRKTLFLEVIERMGAKTFGSGNIKALYEAVEQERRVEDERP